MQADIEKILASSHNLKNSWVWVGETSGNIIELLERTTGQVSFPVPSGCPQSLHGELLHFSVSLMLFCITISAFVFMFICTVYVKETKDGHKWSVFVGDSLRACALVFANSAAFFRSERWGLDCRRNSQNTKNVHIQTYPIVAGVNSRVCDGTYNLLSIHASVAGGHCPNDRRYLNFDHVTGARFSHIICSCWALVNAYSLDIWKHNTRHLRRGGV